MAVAFTAVGIIGLHADALSGVPELGIQRFLAPKIQAHQTVLLEKVNGNDELLKLLITNMASS